MTAPAASRTRRQISRGVRSVKRAPENLTDAEIFGRTMTPWFREMLRPIHDEIERRAAALEQGLIAEEDYELIGEPLPAALTGEKGEAA